jgi:hypothetical protein
LLLPRHFAHLPFSISLAAIILAIIYDIYSTFHVAVYIPTLIKQFVRGNSMNNHIVTRSRVPHVSQKSRTFP